MKGTSARDNEINYLTKITTNIITETVSRKIISYCDIPGFLKHTKPFPNFLVLCHPNMNRVDLIADEYNRQKLYEMFLPLRRLPRESLKRNGPDDKAS